MSKKVQVSTSTMDELGCHKNGKVINNQYSYLYNNVCEIEKTSYSFTLKLNLKISNKTGLNICPHELWSLKLGT